jgi:hypothetical protein
LDFIHTVDRLHSQPVRRLKNYWPGIFPRVLVLCEIRVRPTADVIPRNVLLHSRRNFIKQSQSWEYVQKCTDIRIPQPHDGFTNG